MAKIDAKERAKRIKTASTAYTKGKQSIREIAAANGWSYGHTHGLLVESGVSLRSRGGPRRTVKQA